MSTAPARPLRAAGLAVSAAALLAGCAAVGPNFKPPAPVTDNQAYTRADEVIPSQAAIGDKVAADWWTLFHSPVLDGLVREAIANNKTLEMARARLAVGAGGRGRRHRSTDRRRQRRLQA